MCVANVEECGREWMEGVRMVGMMDKIGIVKYDWVCANAPVNSLTRMGKEKQSLGKG